MSVVGGGSPPPHHPAPPFSPGGAASCSGGPAPGSPSAEAPAAARPERPASLSAGLQVKSSGRHARWLLCYQSNSAPCPGSGAPHSPSPPLQPAATASSPPAAGRPVSLPAALHRHHPGECNRPRSPDWVTALWPPKWGGGMTRSYRCTRVHMGVELYLFWGARTLLAKR